MRRQTSVVIVGSGFSGLGMAIQLKKAGVNDFVILEKADDIGGTWRDNTYPGCACDVPSPMYSFSFEPNPRWSRMFATQPEIWDYQHRLADKHQLWGHIRFGQQVTGGSYRHDTGTWQLSTADGDVVTSRAIVLGVGALHHPKIPKLRGLNRFQGKVFHSAHWDHNYDLAGKRVAVIGTGASAIQFVPKIAQQVSALHLFQRTPPWIHPRPDFPIAPSVTQAFQAHPGLQRLFRNTLYWLMEIRAMGFAHPTLMAVDKMVARRHLRAQVPDPVLRAKLTPDYTIGCKRILVSNDYYPTLSRPNVDLITEGIVAVREHSIITYTGRQLDIDAIIFATGFHAVDTLQRLDLTGRDGLTIHNAWRDGPQAHLGITVTGFPNAFLLFGPNTALGHHSVIFMIESQIRYIMHCLRPILSGTATAIEVLPRTQQQFNHKLQNKLTKSVWNTGGCHSWYLDQHSVNRAIWPRSTWRYWLATRTPRTRDYQLTP